MAAATPQQLANVPQYASVSTSATADIVSGVAGYFVVLDAYVLVPAAAVTVTWSSHTAGAITGAMPIGGTSAPLYLAASSTEGLCQTAAGEALTLTLGSAVAVNGHVSYRLVRAS